MAKRRREWMDNNNDRMNGMKLDGMKEGPEEEECQNGNSGGKWPLDIFPIGPREGRGVLSIPPVVGPMAARKKL
jgi:hypothetical protein